MSTYASPTFETLTYGELQCSTCIASIFAGPTFVAWAIFIVAVYLYGAAYTTALAAVAYLAAVGTTWAMAVNKTVVIDGE